MLSPKLEVLLDFSVYNFTLDSRAFTIFFPPSFSIIIIHGCTCRRFHCLFIPNGLSVCLCHEFSINIFFCFFLTFVRFGLFFNIIVSCFTCNRSQTIDWARVSERTKEMESKRNVFFLSSSFLFSSFCNSNCLLFLFFFFFLLLRCFVLSLHRELYILYCVDILRAPLNRFLNTNDPEIYMAMKYSQNGVCFGCVCIKRFKCWTRANQLETYSILIH